MVPVNRPPRLDPPRLRRRAVPAFKRWFGRGKRRVGYYRLRDGLRNRAREPRFLRSLRPTDVFLVGHPKSGNTWLAYMLAVLLSDDREGEVNLYNVGDHVPFVHGRDHEIAAWDHLPDPRVFRNEYPRYPHRYPGTLYLVRDPRAVLVSFWHMFATMFDDRAMTLSRFVDGYLSGGAPFDAWHRHLRRWDRQVAAALRRAEGGERVCIVRYEDLVSDREAALRRVAHFIGAVPAEDVPAGTSERLSRAAARGSFEAMRDLEGRHGAEAYAGRARGEGRFVRRGQAEGWKDEMDPADAARIEAAFGPVMERAGYLA
ncbi:sulfotransferase domain-containing protein [Candidatus Palauibacter irciniicola]|uniref:sulfotransferase domain-containing protein n=1 Tax=Candidatus Palauibacter irciniicola TaxID=3056733 RepID=UPI003B01CE28